VAFGKELKRGLVREWSSKYVQYGVLKKMLEEIKLLGQEHHDLEIPRTPVAGGNADFNFEAFLTAPDPDNPSLHTRLDKDLERNDPAVVQHRDGSTGLKWGENGGYDEESAHADTQGEAHGNPQGGGHGSTRGGERGGQLAPGEASAARLRLQVTMEGSEIVSTVSGAVSGKNESVGKSLETRFFSKLDDGVRSASAFYYQMEEECFERWKALDAAAKHMNREDKEIKQELRSVPGRKSDLMGHFAVRRLDIEQHRDTLTEAFQDLFRKLCLLKRFKVENCKAVHKILKKHDKVSVQLPKTSKIYMEGADQTFLFAEQQIDKIINLVEKSYKNNVADDLKAFNKMELLDNGAALVAQAKADALAVGLLTGISVSSLVILLTVAAAVPPSSTQVSTHLPSLFVFRGLSLLYLHLLLLIVDMALWESFRINFSFIMGMEHLKGVRKERLARYISMVVMLTSVSALVYYLVSSPEISELASAAVEQPLSVWPFWKREMVPFVLVIVLMSHFLNPFFLVHWRINKRRHPRVYILRNIAKMLATPWYHVQFQHFWLADQLVSQSVALQDLAFATCYYTTGQFLQEGSDTCAPVSFGGWVATAVAMVPGWIRLLQCARRYRDSQSNANWGQVHPHLTNLAKYALGLIATALAAASRFDPSVKPAYYVFASLSTFYAFSWDIGMDWGVVSIKDGAPTFLPRGISMLHDKEDGIPAKIKLLYACSVVSNLFLRLTWAWGLVADIPDSALKVWLLGALEVCRRGQWNLLRLEYEHMGNVDQYRATRDIPLPGTMSAPNVAILTSSLMGVQDDFGRDMEDKENGGSDGSERMDDGGSHVVGCDGPGAADPSGHGVALLAEPMEVSTPSPEVPHAQSHRGQETWAGVGDKATPGARKRMNIAPIEIELSSRAESGVASATRTASESNSAGDSQLRRLDPVSAEKEDDVARTTVAGSSWDRVNTLRPRHPKLQEELRKAKSSAGNSKRPDAGSPAADGRSGSATPKVGKSPVAAMSKVSSLFGMRIKNAFPRPEGLECDILAMDDSESDEDQEDAFYSSSTPFQHERNSSGLPAAILPSVRL